MSDPVTESDHNDLREQVQGLLRYVEQLEERLDNQHQALASHCQDEIDKLHERLDGQPGLEGLSKIGGASSIVDADEVDEQQVVAEIERMARGEL